MSKAIKFPIKESFVLHSILNYLDKAVSLISPIVILKFLHNNLLYNKIEYILSSSIILSVFWDGGLASYYFYGYRISSDREKYVQEIEADFFALFAAEAFMSLLVLAAGFAFFSYSILVFACVLIMA